MKSSMRTRVDSRLAGRPTESQSGGYVPRAEKSLDEIPTRLYALTEWITQLRYLRRASQVDSLDGQIVTDGFQMLHQYCTSTGVPSRPCQSSYPVSVPSTTGSNAWSRKFLRKSSLSSSYRSRRGSSTMNLAWGTGQIHRRTAFIRSLGCSDE